MRGPHEQSISVNNISLNNGEEKINITNPNLTCQKLARFIFPKTNPVRDPNCAVDDRSLPEKFLNTMYNILKFLTGLGLKLWNNIWGRDLIPSQEVDADQIVLTFRRSDERAVSKVSHPENSNFQVNSSDLSTPKNSVEISKLET